MALSTRALSRAAIVAALAISACSTDKNNTAAFAVTASQPSEGQTIAANSPVGVSFNRAPKTASATFAPDAGAVTTTISGNAASFAPASGSFAAGIAYTVTVTATDANDNGLASPFVVHFNTSAPDTAAPAAVTDLTADSVTSTGVTLHWTATGDDGDTGTATAYEVRYLSGSNCPITVANFGTSGTGTLVTPVAAPKPARSAETLAVTGLTASTSYCFALRVADEAGNLSPISNVATATTSSTADGIPPAAPVVTGVAGNTNVFLQFTAVGDDGNVGTAAQYVVTFEGPVTSCPTTLAGFVNPHAPLTSPGNLPPPDAAGTAETLPVLGLQQRSLYCFVVTVKDAAGNSANSNVVAATTTGTTQAAPSAITDLRATIDGVTNNGSLTQKATLTWTAPDTFDGQSAARYSIRFATFSGATCPLTSANAGTASEIANPPAPQNPGGEESFDVTYALPDILHGVCFAILSQSLSSPLSPISDLATPPIEISDLSVNAGTLTDTSADLTFTAPIFQTGTAAADFLLAYLPETAAGCPAFGSDIPTLDGAVVNDFGASIAGTSVPMTGLQPNTGYCASLLVEDNGGDAAWSTVVEVITGGGPPPVAIADLRVNVRGMLGSENEDLEAAANLTWSAPADSSGNAVGSYLFLAGVDDSCPITAGNQASQPVRQQPGTTPGAPGSKETFDLFVPTNLLTDNVCFAIIAIDKTGVFSNLSNVALPPVGVSDLDQGDATNDTSADLGMSQPVFQAGTTPAPFQYALVPAPGGGNCPQFGSQLAGLPGATLTPIAGLENQHQLPITGLTPNTNYCVALLSTDTAGDSAWSNVAPVNTTDQSAPPPPPNVAVTGTTDTTISIQFDSVVDNDRAQTGVALQYDVVYQAVADCSQFQPNADQSFDETGVITAPGQHVDVTLEGLTPVTHYCFFVNATNGGGQVGNGSATFDATTQAPGGGNGGPRPAAITTLPRRRR